MPPALPRRSSPSRMLLLGDHDYPDREAGGEAPVMGEVSAIHTLPAAPRTPTTTLTHVSAPWDENPRIRGETAIQALSRATTQERHVCSVDACKATQTLPIRMSAHECAHHEELKKMSPCALALE